VIVDQTLPPPSFPHLRWAVFTRVKKSEALLMGLDANFTGQKLSRGDHFRKKEEKYAFFSLLSIGQNT